MVWSGGFRQMRQFSEKGEVTRHYLILMTLNKWSASPVNQLHILTNLGRSCTFTQQQNTSGLSSSSRFWFKCHPRAHISNSHCLFINFEFRVFPLPFWKIQIKSVSKWKPTFITFKILPPANGAPTTHTDASLQLSILCLSVQLLQSRLLITSAVWTAAVRRGCGGDCRTRRRQEHVLVGSNLLKWERPIFTERWCNCSLRWTVTADIMSTSSSDAQLCNLDASHIWCSLFYKTRQH